MAKRRKKTKKRRAAGGLTKQTYSCSAALQEIVGSKKLTRPQIVKKLWIYIKAHKRQDPKKRRMIVPDKKLAAVLGSRPIDMLKIAGCLNKHIKK
ncbi:MAG: SWIB/MDM2 domain-containing protein [Chlamydiae bacterium]|nr:SWIB/MDM2 domain-containing protein [Chlamydiota bacterium]